MVAAIAALGCSSSTSTNSASSTTGGAASSSAGAASTSGQGTSAATGTSSAAASTAATSGSATTTGGPTSSSSGTVGSTTTGGTTSSGGPRPWPDTSASIVVYSDQFELSSSTEAQVQFAATHYAGAQKLLLQDIQHLRQYNSGFLLLHYRLGQALGDSAPNGNCQPTTSYTQVIDGNDWVQEWPGDAGVASWFYDFGGAMVFNCTFGWYLAELDSPTWRAYWPPLVVQQMQACDADGVFADSYSIPNYFGATDFEPNLPVVDAGFEQSWATLEHDFTDYMRTFFAGQYVWVPNVGSYITSRDPSDYSNVDGVMIEGFAELGGGNYLALSDWALQMNRVLALVGEGKILIGQTYPTDTDLDERMFILGTYLLIKGDTTYVNMEAKGQEIQWFPEYGVDLGVATDPLPTDISTFLDATSGAYIRHYANGLVLVNPGASTLTASFMQTYYQVAALGGGVVGADGGAPGSLSTSAVTSVTLAPDTAAVLLNGAP
jgi:Hypothetical glycosyl hydrolase family 15